MVVVASGDDGKPRPAVVIPAARRADRYARGVGGAAARKINKIPAARPAEKRSMVRAAGISQTNALPDTHASVVICQTTPDIADAPDFRVSVEPTETNGLRLRSQIMADKPVTVVRRRIGQTIRRIGQEDPGRLNAALAFVIGLAD